MHTAETLDQLQHLLDGIETLDTIGGAVSALAPLLVLWKWFFGSPSRGIEKAAARRAVALERATTALADPVALTQEREMRFAAALDDAARAHATIGHRIEPALWYRRITPWLALPAITLYLAFLWSLITQSNPQATGILLGLAILLAAAEFTVEALAWAWRRHTAPRKHGPQLVATANHDQRHPAVAAYRAERGAPVETWPTLTAPRPRLTPTWVLKLTAWTLRGWWWRATTNRSTPTEKATGAILCVLGALMTPVQALTYAVMLANPRRRWVATSWTRGDRHLEAVVSLHHKHGRIVDINSLIANHPTDQWAALPLRHHLAHVLAWADHEQVALTAGAAQKSRVAPYQRLLPGLEKTGTDGLGHTHLRRLPRHP